MRIYKVVIFVVCVLLFMIFEVGSSEFVCNPSVCLVTNKNLLGFTRSTVPVYPDIIKDFEVRETYSFFAKSRWNRYEYKIYALTKNGYAYPFFGTSRSSHSQAELTVKELRNALRSNSKNIRIRY